MLNKTAHRKFEEFSIDQSDKCKRWRNVGRNGEEFLRAARILLKKKKIDYTLLETNIRVEKNKTGRGKKNAKFPWTKSSSHEWTGTSVGKIKKEGFLEWKFNLPVYIYIYAGNSNSACNKRPIIHDSTFQQTLEMNFDRIPPIAPILHLRICLPANNSPAPPSRSHL